MERKILVIDDDESVMELMESILPLAKYRILKAGSEADALKMLSHDSPDAAIIDIHLTKTKDMQGLGLCRRIKENLRTQHIPVIMIRARDKIIWTFGGPDLSRMQGATTMV